MANGRMIAAAAAKRAMQQEATTTPTTIAVMSLEVFVLAAMEEREGSVKCPHTGYP